MSQAVSFFPLNAMFFKVFSFALIYSSYLVQSTTYDGYKVYDVYARSDLDKDVLLDLYRKPEYDFFSLPRALDEAAQVMVSPEAQAEFEATLNRLGANFSLVDEDVGQTLLQEDIINIRSPTENIFDRFHNHSEINDYLEKLKNDHFRRVHVRTVGQSYEDRDMKLIIITNGNLRRNKKAIFVDAGIHAREWLAPATALYIIHQLVENFEANSELLEDFNWFILPVANPDGYEHSFTSARFWRKNRKPTANPKCVGTDLNRNFAYKWGGKGTSNRECEATFHGVEAESEPETRVIRDIMHALAKRTKFYLTLHSHGQYLLYPWGYDRELPSNWQDIHRVASAGAAAMMAASGSQYKFGASSMALYPAAGGSDDYALHIGIPISITMELPTGDTSHGFGVSPEWIETYAKQSWIGIKAMAVAVNDLYQPTS